MRVKISRMGLEGLDRFVVPPPEVILGSIDSVSLSMQSSRHRTDPKDIPPRRGLSRCHSRQPIVCRLQDLLAPQH